MGFLHGGSQVRSGQNAPETGSPYHPRDADLHAPATEREASVMPDVRRSRLLLAGLVCACLAGCSGSASTSSVATTPSSVATRPSADVAATPTASSGSASAAAPSPGPTAKPELSLVSVGDSIPFNSRDDCPGCTGFVDLYARDLGIATGKTVGVRNLSQHNGLQVQGLLDELGDGSERAVALAEADAIIVGIAHNDVPMNVDDDPCDGAGGDNPDWSKFTAACIATEVKRYTPKYEAVFERIAALRAGKPTT